MITAPVFGAFNLNQGLDANKPLSPKLGDLYLATDLRRLYAAVAKENFDLGNLQEIALLRTTLDTIESIQFSPDGLNLFVLSAPRITFTQYKLSKAWDVNSAVFYDTFYADRLTQANGFYIEPTGQFVYVVGTSPDWGYECVESFLMLNNFDLKSIQWAKKIEGNASVFSKITGVSVNPSENKLFAVGTKKDDGQGALAIYNIPTKWDVETMTLTHVINSIENNPQDIYINPTGTKMFIPDESAIPGITQYSLENVFDPSSLVKEKNVASRSSGCKYRIAFSFKIPPSDGWSNQNKINNRTITYLSDNASFSELGDMKILNPPEDKIYLMNTDGTSKGLELSPNTRVFGEDTIEQEFLLINEGSGKDPRVECDGTTTSGFTATGGTLSLDGGRLKITGRATNGTALAIRNTLRRDWSDYDFLMFEVECDKSKKIWVAFQDAGNKLLSFKDRDIFQLEAGVKKTFVLPIKAPAASVGLQAESMSAGFGDFTSCFWYIGVSGEDTTDTNLYIDNVRAVKGSWAQVEMCVNQSLLTDPSIWLGTKSDLDTAYERHWEAGLVGTFTQISSNHFGLKTQIGSTLPDLYGTGGVFRGLSILGEAGQAREGTWVPYTRLPYSQLGRPSGVAFSWNGQFMYEVDTFENLIAAYRTAQRAEWYSLGEVDLAGFFDNTVLDFDTGELKTYVGNTGTTIIYSDDKQETADDTYIRLTVTVTKAITIPSKLLFHTRSSVAGKRSFQLYKNGVKIGGTELNESNVPAGDFVKELILPSVNEGDTLGVYGKGPSGLTTSDYRRIVGTVRTVNLKSFF